jgi:diguanylate cyclase (GGDEF)-like protein
MIFLAVWMILGLLQVLIVFTFGQSRPYVIQYIILMGTCVLGTNLLLEFSRLYSEKMDLEKRVVMDTLTTAYNRNILGKASSEQYDAIILMDLDNFKAYNDKYGHQKGDQLLIKFTEIVKNNLRQEDIVVRYGGDEFVVLLHGISIIDAEHVALRISHDLEDSTQAEDHLGVSYGIEKMEHSLDSDLDKADHLMYAMKQAKQIHERNEKMKQDKS